MGSQKNQSRAQEAPPLKRFLVGARAGFALPMPARTAAVRVECASALVDPHQPQSVCIEIGIAYYGTAEELITAGVATAAMLAPGRPGLSRRDGDGDRYWFSRW